MRGYRWNKPISPTIPYTGPTPEYWWRADYGLSTSTWTAYTGGYDLTLVNVVSANGTSGVYFNGSTGHAFNPTLFSPDLDAKHVMMRFDLLNKPPENGGLIAMLGGTVDNNHEAFAYQPAGGFYWYFLEYTSTGVLSYAVRGTDSSGTSTLWADFANGGANIDVYADGSNTSTAHSAYVGTFNNRFRWPALTSLYIGRREAGSYASFYLKELAIFTTALSSTDALGFRNNMNARWP